MQHWVVICVWTHGVSGSIKPKNGAAALTGVTKLIVELEPIVELYRIKTNSALQLTKAIWLHP